MKYKIENCNYYVMKELLESGFNNISSIERFDPETTIVKFEEKVAINDLLSVIERHPIKSVVSALKINAC